MFLSINSILEFINSTPKSRNFVDGEKLINAGHLISCVIVNDNSEAYELLAFSLQTSDLMKETLHEILFTITKSGVINAAKCSCNAGLGEKCKHIVAALIFCTRNNISELEHISCADEKYICDFSRENSLENYTSNPLRNHQCFGISHSDSPIISDDVKAAIRAKLFSSDIESALSVHMCNKQIE